MIKLEHGKYYMASGGRKIGPMVRWDDGDGGNHQWQVGLHSSDSCTRDFDINGDLWRSDGTSQYTGEDGQLVAEWIDETDETDATITPYEIAAQYKIIVTVTIGEITVSYDGRDK